jgi:hypothetical protein
MATRATDPFTELHQAALGAAQGLRDRTAVDEACEGMDRRREELRKKLGELQLTSELIREVREP